MPKSSEKPAAPHFVMAHLFGESDPAPALRQFALAASSVRRLYRHAPLTLLTDRPCVVQAFDPAVGAVAIGGFGGEMMFARLVAYRDFAVVAPENELLVFMDTDMLLRRRIDPILTEPFDIAVTVRNWAEQPVNGGLIFVHTRRRKRVLGVFDALVETCRALPEAERRWFGDQIALERVLDAPPLSLYRRARGTSFGADILYLPVKVWNNTPRPWQLRLCLASPFARILHFQGDRKRHMARYHAALMRR